MSKPPSGLFRGTAGEREFRGNAEEVIASRVAGLDLRAHPLTQEQLSFKQRKEIKKKIAARTATKEEYKRSEWQRRLDARRKKGSDDFWDHERALLEEGLGGTRNWSQEQRDAILMGKKPRYNGRVLEAHHTYSVKLFPHLANHWEVIYPATHFEHRYGWHGGNSKASLPGRRIRIINEM